MFNLLPPPPPLTPNPGLPKTITKVCNKIVNYPVLNVHEKTEEMITLIGYVEGGNALTYDIRTYNIPLSFVIQHTHTEYFIHHNITNMI